MRRRPNGFSFIELLIAAALVALAAMAAAAHVTRGTQRADWSQDRIFARQKALSILAELRAYVEGGEGEVAADLDGFDDGVSWRPNLTIQPDPNDPGSFLHPEHAASGNTNNQGVWSWQRQISVRRFPTVNTRDLRICTVRVFRRRFGDVDPGEKMAEVSGVIRTIGDSFPSTQVYDVYLLALDNVPGWWVFMDAMQPFVEATLTDLEGRNPGLRFRTHWITKSGYGRDDEYAPYTNESRISTDPTPWAYVYPGRMPDGSSAQRYYVAQRFAARVNLDGELAPSFQNDMEPMEPYTDANGNGRRDPGEVWSDLDGDLTWDAGNPVPFAMADMHNHCMRSPDEVARFDARVAAGQEDPEIPTWRMLLDRMIAQPNRYHNAILLNLHGELLPMPAVRNYSDAAKIPDVKAGWRAVAHPEKLRSIRVAGSPASSQEIAWRVYAYKTLWQGVSGLEKLTTQQEPFTDSNNNGAYDLGEPFEDWNNDTEWSTSMPIMLSIPGGRFDQSVNAASSPSLVVERLSGGIDADGDSAQDPYVDWTRAARYPDVFTDTNADLRRQVAEVYLDLDGNGSRDPSEPFTDLDGDGVYTAVSEPLAADYDGDGQFDTNAPEETYTDTNGNGRWDAQEPYWDVNGNGVRDLPTVSPAPAWQPWDPVTYDASNASQVSTYVSQYGEPFLDVDGDGTWDAAEPLVDGNGNGVHDGGYHRGEMWFDIRYDGTQTLLWLYGTPLETGHDSTTGRGLPADRRLYEMDYIPCPMPASTASGGDRFARDLYDTTYVPKNTARWRISMSPSSLRTGFASTPGGSDGDAVDRVVRLETRWGHDASTGTLWPTRNQPANKSATFAWYTDSVDDIPFSERYQFQGDPRHMPYADCDRYGATSPNGYNWFFDDLVDSGNVWSDWPGLDGARLRHAWQGNRGSSLDVPRLLSWLRYAVVRTEAIYTTLTGFSYYYLSVGGDVGYDAANGFNDSIPMDGTPFGLTGSVYENTIIPDNGTSSLRGSLKYVRSTLGGDSSFRAGTGYWWSKPWIGELYPDVAYASEWAPWGNLKASATPAADAFRLMRRGDVTTSQLPRGTRFSNVFARLADEGCTSLFNIGTSSSTFHHQYADGQSGNLVDDGPQLADNYNFPLPSTALISRPFALNANYSGGTGPEFSYTTEYPRFSAAVVRRFYDHQIGSMGSALVRLREPGASPRGGYVVVNGIDRTLESGSAFIARYSMLSLIHSYFAGGVSAPNRIKQLPRIQIRTPTLLTELELPSVIPLIWSVEWKRWDGLKYTQSYADSFAEAESDLVYVPCYSKDGGASWINMLDDSPIQLGILPWDDAADAPDSSKTLSDLNPLGDETYIWVTPDSKLPKGSYLIRVEAYRRSEPLHYAQHMEKIYVNR
ncbi:MAG: prepilin-type N-terminal cleavage/methylation domain-containing protein [Planctomycetota bacterium]